MIDSMTLFTDSFGSLGHKIFQKGADIFFGSADHEVVVIVHQHKSMNFDTKSIYTFIEEVNINAKTVIHGNIEPVPVVRASSDMIGVKIRGYNRFSTHASNKCKA